MNHRNAISIDMPLFVYIAITLLLCTTIAKQKPSKLLTLPQDTSTYFTSQHHSFNIDDDDYISTITVTNNTLTISTHLNANPITLKVLLPDYDIRLDYDSPIDWTEIHESDTVYLNTLSHGYISKARSNRRRLGWWNHVKWKGRYVADGITRRFKDAKATCRHLYGALASIMSKREEEQVKDLCAMWNRGNCYIGYEKPWGHWGDGRRPVYLHWKPGEPNNYGGREGCAEISSAGQWNDIKCKEQRIAICERARIHVVGHYVAVMRAISWHSANHHCQVLFSTDLATIENARENIMVRRACSALSAEKECWIGLKRPFRTWNDGEDAKITNWADGEPNNAGGNENCAAIQESQRWNDAPCSEPKYFVCNTITQDVRVKKRAEAKRRRQEKEAELEKKRKKMEDEIMERYMQSNHNGQGQKPGQSMVGGMQMHRPQYPGMNPQMSVPYGQPRPQGMHGMFGGYNNVQPFNHGLETGGIGSSMHPQQMDSVYGSLGQVNGGLNMHPYRPGHPLQIQLVGQSSNSGFGFRRRVLGEWDRTEIYGQKCRVISGGEKELCVGRDYVNIKSLVRAGASESLKRFRMGNGNVTSDAMYGDLVGYEQWKYSAVFSDESEYSDSVQYILSKQLVYESGKQCFDAQLFNGFEICLEFVEKDMILSVNNERFKFGNDNDWNEIEMIHSSGTNEVIVNKCMNVYLGEMGTKICIQQTQNMYKANVQLLAANVPKGYLHY